MLMNFPQQKDPLRQSYKWGCNFYNIQADHHNAFRQGPGTFLFLSFVFLLLLFFFSYQIKQRLFAKSAG